MIEKYYDDYYKGKIKINEILKKENINKYYFNKELKSKNLKLYISYFKDIKTGENELDKILCKKYSSIVNRCNGKTTDLYGHYNNMEYLTIQQYVDFCKENTLILLKLWEKYIQSGKDFKYAISIDRLDNNEGYLKNNMQFTTVGFNSWKASLNPIKIKYQNKELYFMSCEEASRYFGFEPKYIGRILNKNINSDIIVAKTNFLTVINNKNNKNLIDYYIKNIKS